MVLAKDNRLNGCVSAVVVLMKRMEQSIDEVLQVGLIEMSRSLNFTKDFYHQPGYCKMEFMYLSIYRFPL